MDSNEIQLAYVPMSKFFKKIKKISVFRTTTNVNNI